MNVIRYIRRSAWMWIAVAIIVIAITTVAPAQTRQILNWQESLNYLQNASNDELLLQQATVAKIRTGVEFWLRMHPGSKFELPPGPLQPWRAEEIRSQVSSLSRAVQAILTEDPSRPFDLGAILVNVTAEASPLSPVTDSFDRDEIVNRQAVTAAAALDYLPGVAIDHISAGRNEASIRIRGFSSKGQVPFYIDGIPVSMPYDGTIDFNRFLSSDIGEVQIAKGFPEAGRNWFFNLRYRF